MNRYDEIQGAAREIAGRVCSDPADRNRLADDLIRLVTFVVAAVGRKLLASEDAPVCPHDQYAMVRTGTWSYRVTWHSRDCAPGRLRLFRKPLASTPWRPSNHDGPSVKGIRDMISRFPRP